MLHVPAKMDDRCSIYHPTYETPPSATPSISVSADGTTTTTLDAVATTEDLYAIELRISNGSVSSTNTGISLDIRIDTAGGTNWSNIITQLLPGRSAAWTAAGAGLHYLFPLFIPAGSSIGALARSYNTGPWSQNIGVRGFTRRLPGMPVGQFSETIGTPFTTGTGQAITPGNNTWGSWVDLGATSKPMWWWQLSHNLDNQVITAEYTAFQLAFGDASNKHLILTEQHGGTTAEIVGNFYKTNLNAFACYCPVPAGANIYVRAFCNNAPDAGYRVMAHGVGG